MTRLLLKRELGMTRGEDLDLENIGRIAKRPVTSSSLLPFRFSLSIPNDLFALL